MELQSGVKIAAQCVISKCDIYVCKQQMCEAGIQQKIETWSVLDIAKIP